MDLHRLEVFCRVFEERSFSGAARLLDLSQPTVSVHVKTLEDELGVTLFDRLGREVEPTAAARFLFDRAHRLLELRQDLLDRLQGFRHQPEGDLEIGSSTIPGEYLLPMILGRFRGAHSRVRIRLRIQDSRRTVEEVQAGKVHLGAVGARLPHAHLEYRTLGRDRLVLIASPGSAWARRQTLSLEELARAPLLMREEGSGTRLRLEPWLRSQGLAFEDLAVVAELGTTTAIKEGVKGGLGISFVSDLAVRSELAANQLTVLQVADLEPVERELFLVLDQRRARSPVTDAFLDFLATAQPV